MPAVSWWKFPPKFNVAPRQYVPAIRVHQGQAEGVMMRWGLIPSWAEGKETGESLACADLEELEQSKALRTPWLESQRCILPMSGFYTWRLNRHRYRQPYFVQLNNRNILGVAAIWDRSEGAEEEVTESCTVVTVPANELLARIVTPPARMPAILRRRDYATWLKGTQVEARAALAPYNAAWMQANSVSPRVNSTEPDDPELIRPM